MSENEKNLRPMALPRLPDEINLKIEENIRSAGMAPLLTGGVLLAFSGGADSTLLFLFLLAYCPMHGIRFEALHLHHGIRGAEADRDAAFCRALCRSAGVPLHAERADIPAIAAQKGEGLEETARKVRYALLAERAKERGLSAIATAHTATDLAETVLFRLARGTGAKGLCGIPAVRGNIVRPLLALRAEEVRAALAAVGASFVNDSTNEDIFYRRNYIRKEILPAFLRLNPSFPDAVERMAASLAEDEDYLSGEAAAAFSRTFDGRALSLSGMRSLHPAVCARVLLLCHERQCPGRERPERVHLAALRAQICAGNTAFSLSFPGGVTAVGKGDGVFFRTEEKAVFHFGITPVSFGKNLLGNGYVLLLTEKIDPDFPANVYRMLIQRDLASAKIEGNLYIRSCKAGDTLRYGGMTRKLKKLFSAAGIPAEKRGSVPVLCDEKGIVWVPGFGVRDDRMGEGEKRKSLFALYYKDEE